MHPIQQKIIALLKDQGSIPLKYREIGRRIGEKYPQTTKYHIEILLDKKLIIEQNGFLKLNKATSENGDFVSLPFYGLASCGSATVPAEDQAEGFLKVSKNIFPKGSVADYYLVRATGNSMNRAKVGPQKVEINDGDLVVVDHTNREPKGGEYVLSVVDGCANIKNFDFDQGREWIILSSESSDEYSPIVIQYGDNYHIMGNVVDVIKMSKGKKQKRENKS